MNAIIFCLLFLSPGGIDAQEAFGDGEIYLLTFGRPSAEFFRDSVTQMLFRSTGCTVREGDLEYMEDWNAFMSDAWNRMISGGTFIVLRTEGESFEYRDGSCVYRDSWGSVPMELYPEEILYLVRLAGAAVRTEASEYGSLVLYAPLLGDTASVTIPVDSDVIRGCFQRGRESIRVNTLN